MQDPIEHFRAAILAAGLNPPEEIEADGRLHRFSTNGKVKDDSGWYMLHLDGVPAGAFGCWRSGMQSTWCFKADHSMTAPEREAHWQRVKAMQAGREAEQMQRQQVASEAAALIWKKATPVKEHQYLIVKGVTPHGIKCDGHHLLIPLRDTLGNLHSLQTIAPDGRKRFQPGGRVKGCYHAIGIPDGVLIVCEGYATGASIHEATGHAVAVAFNAGNLLAVAHALRLKYPALKIVLAADDDAGTPGNPGLTKAVEAARAVDGYLTKPDFGGERPIGVTDFNDLRQVVGAEAVRTCMEAAVMVASKPTAIQELDSAAEHTWPDPVPLPDALPPVKAFDSDLMPEALGGWVADIADRMQCPPDFAAVGALVALSGLIGARAVVSPKERDDWRVVPNLWGLTVGRPGVMKSPALSEVLKPLHHLESTERERWKSAHEAWHLDCKVAEMATEDNARKARGLAAKEPSRARELLAPVDIPAEPLARRYVVNDATVEKLGELLTVNHWGLLVYRDELHGLLCSMDRQGQEGARGFYLTGYDGNQGHAVDRISRGETYIRRVCLAMLGSIQPGKLQTYVREAVAGGAGDDGLLQRFGLAVWPDVNREFSYVDRCPDPLAKQAAWAVFDRLNQLQPASDETPQVWRFTPDAQALFEAWLIPFENEIRGEELHPALVSHLSKYRKLIPALALLFALVDTPHSGGVIHPTELIRALAWGEYLRSHAERIYAVAVIPETAGAKQLLDKIKAGTSAVADVDALDEDALLAELGIESAAPTEDDITVLRHVRSSAAIRAAEEVADRTKCADFERFQPLFEQVEQELKTGVRKTLPFGRDASILSGNYFILSGQLAYVAEVGDTIKAPNGESDARLRVIFSNGTESNLLRRSLQRALYKDETGRRLTDPGMGPLFGETMEEGDVESGTIYVLRSKSDHPYVAEHRELVHKIGVTGGKVETRIANAALEATYLLAEVEIVATYKLAGINRTKLENLFHRIFAAAQLDLTIQDRFGHPVRPREWFLVPLHVIDEVVRMLVSGEITEMAYDPSSARLVCGT